jgi:SAM-dependent methyltransferase
LSRPLRRAVGLLLRLAGLRREPTPTSADYRVLSPNAEGSRDGWRTTDVAERQHAAFAALIADARQGSPRQDFVVAANAIRRTGLPNPRVLEVGCGSGYYSEVLPLLLASPIRYVGLDYSVEMVRLARRTFPADHFIAGDARALPFKSGHFDVVLSGTSLMHIREYDRAIRESARVCGGWCVFHTVPVIERRHTTFLEKRAYGESVLEVIFNRAELERLFAQHGLRVVATEESIAYDVSAVLHEPTRTLTYLCQAT